LRSLVVVVLIAAGCLVRDPERCDEQHKNCPNGQTCDFKSNKCVASDLGMIIAEDLSVGDLEMADSFAGKDGGVHPDLLRECDASAECSDPARPICGGSVCRGCVAGDDNQCGEHAGVPYCQADAGRCVVCTPATEATSCPSPSPICTSAGACRACTSDDECATKVCKSDGTCATANEVAYVDNAGVANYMCGMGLDAGVGSASDPFCEIQMGIDTGKPYVRVTGHAGAPYNSISVTTTRNVTVVGPEVGEPAIILAKTSTDNDVKLQLSSAASVTLIRVQIGSASSASSQDAVLCNGTGAVSPVVLAILNSSIFKSVGYGVNSTHCTLTLDSDRIALNVSGGVILTNANKYTITNDYIYRNMGTAVQIDPLATGAFQLNTIVNNTASAGYAGVNCNSTVQPVEGSIFWNNKVTGSLMEEFGCNMIRCDVDSVDPMFVDNNNDDYRFTNAALVDAVPANVDGGAGPFPAHDIFGTRRPLGNGFDVGAFEKQ
jgi:hypothetical protein